jgi:hypothetical protein
VRDTMLDAIRNCSPDIKTDIDSTLDGIDALYKAGHVCAHSVHAAQSSADVAGVLVQMWPRRAHSCCRRGRGEPSRGADAAGVVCHSMRREWRLVTYARCVWVPTVHSFAWQEDQRVWPVELPGLEGRGHLPSLQGEGHRCADRLPGLAPHRDRTACTSLP